jgi:hypothetical protein
MGTSWTFQLKSVVVLVVATAAASASLAVIGGGAFALSKIDEGFGEFIEEASCKVRLLSWHHNGSRKQKLRIKATQAHLAMHQGPVSHAE